MKELIDKQREGRLTLDELERLRRFFETASYEELAEYFPETSESQTEEPHVSDLMISRIKSHIDLSTGANIPSISRYRQYRNIAIAASIVIPLLAMSLVAIIIKNTNNTSIENYVLATGHEESSTLSLPDGTNVIVNGNSMLSTSGFSTESRHIKFEGEAYFDVTRDPEHPFRIETDEMTVEVYGTSFNLLSRANCTYSQLTLDSGEVRLSIDGRDDTVTLNQGQTLLYDKKSGLVTINELSTTTSSWRTGEMFFHQAPPEYVIERIEQTYNISLDTSITNSIDLNFTGMLPSNNLDEALTIIRNIY